MNRIELVDRCKVIIKEAYEEATEMIVAYLELHEGEALKPLCREIDPENPVALESRVRRARERRAAAGAESSASRAAETARKARSHAKTVLREAAPEEIAEMLAEPEVQAKVSQASQIASEKRERKSREKEREALGAEADDELREQQTLRDAEGELFKARRATVEMLRLLNQSTEAGLTDSWREEFLRTIDDVEAKLGLARALLVGDLAKDLGDLLEVSS